jgi:RNA polymerase subunit RPABC4/transcription elongation factor Spt4
MSIKLSKKYGIIFNIRVLTTGVIFMKICPKCNIEYSDEFSFCRRCGTSLIQEVQENVCPNCGKRLEDTFEFCPYCGASLTPNDIEPKNIETVKENIYIPEEPSNSIPIKETINKQEVSSDDLSNIDGNDWAKTGCAILVLILGVGFILSILASFMHK